MPGSSWGKERVAGGRRARLGRPAADDRTRMHGNGWMGRDGMGWDAHTRTHTDRLAVLL